MRIEKWGMKSPTELEKIVKGYANHHRIRVIQLLAAEPDLTLEQITERLNLNFKTASEHVRRLALAGLVWKRYRGLYVHHGLTPRAKSILKFLRILE